MYYLFQLHRTRSKYLLLTLLGMLTTLGCTTTFLRTTNVDTELVEEERSTVRLVGHLTRPWGHNSVAVESVALVTGLNNTGSDPPVSSRRAVLLKEMQTHSVNNPQTILASPKTSLVIVRALMPPGVQKGDRLDLEVRVPSRSETTSLRSGWLMQTRLRELAVLDNQIHAGHVRSLGEGTILVDSLVEGNDDPVLETRGRILGGGMASDSRDMGLTMKSDFQSVRLSAKVGHAINRRFHTFARGIKRGAATPKNDRFVQVSVHPRYRHNLARYMKVIQNIPIGEVSQDRVERLETLKKELRVPSSSGYAALQLEAIGQKGIPLLRQELANPNDEIRFHVAEALAYQNDSQAAPVLAQLAESESAFRWRCMSALSSLDALVAHDHLSELLHVTSAEARYGAFLALQNMNPLDPLVKGRLIGDKLSLHRIATTGEPLIHISTQRRPEIVMFGHQQTLRLPCVLFASDKIMIKAETDKRVKVTKFSAAADDQTQICSSEIGDLIRCVVHLGGTYPDVIQALQEAKEQNCLSGRLVFDARPKPFRTYERKSVSEEEKVDDL